jgi:fatty-acid desaturase
MPWGRERIVGYRFGGARRGWDCRLKLKTDTLIGFILCHLLAMLALLPMFFSWTGVVLAAAGLLAFGVLGVNVGFHRLLTHRSFSCPLWFEHVLAVLGTCSAQFSPPFWVAIHRRHHHFSDDELDPHSPLRSFFWAHCGWLLVRPDDMKPVVMIDRYARDLMRDPLYAALERRKNWMKLSVLAWLVFFVAGFVAALAVGESLWAALRFGGSLFVWGGPLRTVLVWHSTWSVNSVTHIWGYRNYATNDDSRNNAIVGLLAAGEGWHNNHHADPGSARHGHKWWEFDLTWQVIKLLAQLGLATKVVLPAPGIAGRGPVKSVVGASATISVDQR